MMHGAAVLHAVFVLLWPLRVRILSRTTACVMLMMHSAAAPAVHTGFPLLAADMANGVFLLGESEDVRVAARFGSGAAIGVVLMMLFLVGVVSRSGHGFSL